jgi:hypothetical protein
MRLPGPKAPENWQNLHRVAKLGLSPKQNKHLGSGACVHELEDSFWRDQILQPGIVAQNRPSGVAVLTAMAEQRPKVGFCRL